MQLKEEAGNYNNEVKSEDSESAETESEVSNSDDSQDDDEDDEEIKETLRNRRMAQFDEILDDINLKLNKFEEDEEKGLYNQDDRWKWILMSIPKW